jgi:hypothetical protein
MNSVLVVHLVLGIVVALSAALFVWRKSGRRITLYALTLQIFIGIYLLSQGLRVRPEHYGLAFVAFAGYMVANGMARKEGNDRNVLYVTIASSAMVVVALFLGLHAVGKM